MDPKFYDDKYLTHECLINGSKLHVYELQKCIPIYKLQARCLPFTTVFSLPVTITHQVFLTSTGEYELLERGNSDVIRNNNILQD